MFSFWLLRVLPDQTLMFSSSDLSLIPAVSGTFSFDHFAHFPLPESSRLLAASLGFPPSHQPTSSKSSPSSLPSSSSTSPSVYVSPPAPSYLLFLLSPSTFSSTPSLSLSQANRRHFPSCPVPIRIQPINCLGIVLTLAGGAGYAYIEYKEGRKKTVRKGSQ
jgi:hypothetical protein